jgi:hypothetical protein
MSRRYIPVLLTAFYWSAWGGIIWWDQQTTKVTDPQLLTATRQPAVVSLASVAQSSNIPILSAVQPELIPTYVISELRTAEAEIFYDDPYTQVTASRAVALHTEPLVSSPALDYLPRGQEFILLRLENGWAEVLHTATQKRGWIWHYYLTPSIPVIAQASTEARDPKTPAPADLNEERPLEARMERVAHRIVNPGVVKVQRKRFADWWPRRQEASVMRLGPAKMFRKRSLRKQARASRRHGLGVRGLFGRYR